MPSLGASIPPTHAPIGYYPDRNGALLERYRKYCF